MEMGISEIGAHSRVDCCHQCFSVGYPNAQGCLGYIYDETHKHNPNGPPNPGQGGTCTIYFKYQENTVCPVDYIRLWDFPWEYEPTPAEAKEYRPGPCGEKYNTCRNDDPAKCIWDGVSETL